MVFPRPISSARICRGSLVYKSVAVVIAVCLEKTHTTEPVGEKRDHPFDALHLVVFESSSCHQGWLLGRLMYSGV